MRLSKGEIKKLYQIAVQLHKGLVNHVDLTPFGTCTQCDRIASEANKFLTSIRQKVYTPSYIDEQNN